MRIYGKFYGFNASEKIDIESPDLTTAFRNLASKNRAYIKYALERDLPLKGRKRILKKPVEELKRIESLAKKEALVVDGVNWPKRFLEAFYGSCKGAGISRAEGAFLQSEASGGCQSLLVQDKKTGEIRLIHTEEDSGLDGGSRFKYPYKVVKMKVDGKSIVFFCYPDVFGWGYSIGINETANFVQVVDDLMPKNKYNKGYFWSTAVSFMCLDCGSISTAKKIMRKLPRIKGMSFNGGYSMHMAQLNGKPLLKSYEFIHEEVRELEAVSAGGRFVIGQGNCALTKDFEKYCYAGYPKRGDGWSLSAANIYVEMAERAKRLLKLGRMAKWTGKGPKDSIKYGLRLLADPRGDVGYYTQSKRKTGYLMTGLPSAWTYAHFVAYLGKNGAEYYLGKGLPKPIKGKEYSVAFHKGYKFVGKKIWSEAEKVYKRWK